MWVGPLIHPCYCSHCRIPHCHLQHCRIPHCRLLFHLQNRTEGPSTSAHMTFAHGVFGCGCGGVLGSGAWLLMIKGCPEPLHAPPAWPANFFLLLPTCPLTPHIPLPSPPCPSLPVFRYGLGQAYELLKMPFYAVYYYRWWRGVRRGGEGRDTSLGEPKGGRKITPMYSRCLRTPKQLNVAPLPQSYPPLHLPSAFTPVLPSHPCPPSGVRRRCAPMTRACGAPWASAT